MDDIDYYALLGVAPDAKTADIKKRYRKLAREFHPDVTTDPDGEARFKQINEAWRVLKSDEARAEYDAHRQAMRDGAAARARAGARGGASAGTRSRGGQGGDPFGGFGAEPGASDDPNDYSEFFRDMFGDRFRDAGHAGFGASARPSGPRRGEDVRASLALPIREAFTGTRVPVSLRAPRVAADGTVEMADRTLNVTIPAGVTSGRSLRLRGQGGAGFEGGEAGDLYIEIAVRDDADFALEGREVSSVVDVAPWELALGATIDVATLGGRVALKVPAGSQSGRRLRLRGRGFPATGPDAAGDHVVVLRVIMPPVDTPERKAAWEQVRDAWPDGLTGRGGA